MATNTFARIENILKETEVLTPEKREELLALLEKLQAETASMDSAQAGNIATQAQAAAEHALRPGHDDAALQKSLGGLAGSVTGFETSHPRLVQVVNTFCTVLSNMGI